MKIEFKSKLVKSIIIFLPVMSIIFSLLPILLTKKILYSIGIIFPLWIIVAAVKEHFSLLAAINLWCGITIFTKTYQIMHLFGNNLSQKEIVSKAVDPVFCIIISLSLLLIKDKGIKKINLKDDVVI